jgi:uncharacterized protein YjbJ (UPF0337 family)
METNTEIGFWNQIKGKIKQKYPIITDEDLLFTEGKEQEMLELIGYKLGKTKEQMHNMIAAL